MNSRFLKYLICVVVFGLAAITSSPAYAACAQPILENIPSTTWSYRDTTEFDDPDLGIAYRYFSGPTWAELYLYDNGYEFIDNAIVEQHFGQVVRDIYTAASVKLPEAELSDPYVLSDGFSEEFEFIRETALVLLTAPDSARVSLVSLGTIDNCFAKIRLSAQGEHLTQGLVDATISAMFSFARLIDARLE